MAVIGKLSPPKVRNAADGMHGDGGGLWLQVRRGNRSWLFRYTSPATHRERLMGLGSVDVVGLAEARELAADYRRLLHEGKDPLDEKRADAARSAATAVTFREAAEEFIAAHAPGWRNTKHAEQWRSTLAAYAFPAIGAMPVAAVDTEAVLRVLRPIWHDKPETASRLRGRIEAVLGAAAVRGWRSGENPARWRGHLAALLPARGKVAAVRHHPAVPWQDVGRVMAALAARGGEAPIALRFLVLTAARSGEVRGATWGEIDRGTAIWTIPGTRMKAGKPHRVPLSRPALDILREAEALTTAGNRNDGLLFPGHARGRPLSDAALSAVLGRVAPGATVHGFRSSFRDWCAEATAYPGEVAEQALAHVVGDKTEAAYRRGDLFEKRRTLMEDWARHCLRAPSDRASGGTEARAQDANAAGPPEQGADAVPVTSAGVALAAAALPEAASPAWSPAGDGVTSPEADFPSPAEAIAELGKPWGDEDYRLVCRALFLKPEQLEAANHPWPQYRYQGRFDIRLDQIPLFTSDELRQLLTSDPRIAAHWQDHPPHEAAFRSWIADFDNAFANALAAARWVGRGTSEQFTAACERLAALAGKLLTVLEPTGGNPPTPGAPTARDILSQGTVPNSREPEDAGRLRELEGIARELVRFHARPDVRGGKPAARFVIGSAVEPAARNLSRLLRFVVLLAERAKNSPLSETILPNKTNFNRAFVQVLFEELVQNFDVMLPKDDNVPREHLTARDKHRQPRGLATVLAKGLIEIAAEKIPIRLASSAEWPSPKDGPHPAIEAVKKAAALGDFAVASRIKRVRAARMAREQPAIASGRDGVTGKQGRGMAGRSRGSR